jgi:hypothetical protein
MGGRFKGGAAERGQEVREREREHAEEAAVRTGPSAGELLGRGSGKGKERERNGPRGRRERSGPREGEGKENGPRGKRLARGGEREEQAEPG